MRQDGAYLILESSDAIVGVAVPEKGDWYLGRHAEIDQAPGGMCLDCRHNLEPKELAEDAW